MKWIYEISLAVLLGVLVYKVLLQRKKERKRKSEEEKLEQYLIELISCYRKYRNVQEAVEEAKERIAEKFGRENVKKNGKEQEQLAYSLLLERLCSLVAETGDRKQHGESLFLKNLSYIREELKEDYLFRQNRSYYFLGLSKLCIIPFFLIPFIAFWATGVLDTLSGYYGGTFSLVTTTMCFVMTAAAYELVAWLEMPDLLQGLNYKVERKMLKNVWISAGINRKMKRHYSYYLFRNEKLKLLQGFGNIREFELKKRWTGICYLCFGIFFCVILRSVEIKQIPQQLNFPKVYTLLEEEEVEAIEGKMKEQFWDLCSGKSTLEEVKEVWSEEKSEVGETAFLQVEQSYREWEEKKKNVWIFLWLIPFGIWGYWKPEFILWLREQNVGEERLKEVRRMQTVFLVLAQDKAMTVEQILEGMEESAVLFRKAIEETVDHFTYDRKTAIEQLRKNAACEQMGRICDTLLACEEAGVEEACNGLEEERAYTLRQQVQERLEHMRERAAVAKLLAYLPFLTVLGLKLILPFVAEGLSQLKLYSSGMSNYF
ncbi:MAG: hypothetical protein ACI4ES_08530 [Roseburia sp.]